MSLDPKEAAAADAPYDVAVIQMSDFRLPGGTTSSVAEEVRAQSLAGISTAMIHVAGSVTNYPNAWSAHIRKVIGLPNVRLHPVQAPLRARVLIIRHPTVLQSTRMPLTAITADTVVIVANHAAVDAAGTWHYDVAATDDRARRIFGKVPIWAPIGPVVREAIQKQKSQVPLREKDWLNVFALDAVPKPRTGWVGSRPIIGRHSRPQLGKWPDKGKDILAAYPADAAYEVKILGGAQVAEKLLGYIPASWEVIPFGGENPDDFLQRIDFWVYMHHPDLREAFGRAAMEALAAGCVAIMPPYLEELFGDAALYAKPTGVRALLDEYSADTQKFLAQSQRAQEFARSFSPEMHIQRLRELGVEGPVSPPRSSALTQENPATLELAAPPAVVDHTVPGPTATRILAVTETTSDAMTVLPTSGAGQSPSEKALAGNRVVEPPNFRTAWVLVGDWSPTVAIPEHALFVPSVSRMNMSETEGAAWLCARVQNIAAQVIPAHVVYCGAAPPQGLLQYLNGAAVQKTWLQTSRGDKDTKPISESTVAAVGTFHQVVTMDSADGRAIRRQLGWTA